MKNVESACIVLTYTDESSNSRPINLQNKIYETNDEFTKKHVQ